MDRIGGDSFAAGFIDALIQRMDCLNAVEFATAASRLKHTIDGDYHRTTVADVQELLKLGGKGRVQR